MEPTRHIDLEAGFLAAVHNGAHRCGALSICDEISIGWRSRLGSAHLAFGANPGSAAFAKTMGNGHPVGGAIGTGATRAQLGRN